VQEVNAAPSRLHENVLFGSVDVKLKLAPVLVVGDTGLAVIVVSGGIRSTVHEKLAGVKSMLPAPSAART
jgi:hypothetical protein